MSHEDMNLQRVIKILVVDDEDTVVKLYQKVISEMGHRVVVAKTGCEAMERINKENFDLIILDLKLPDIHGCKLLDQIKGKIGDAPVIIATAHPTLESSIAAIRAGSVYDYIIKPFGSDDLNLVIRRAVEKALLKNDNKRLLKRLEIANQALMERVEQLEKIATVALDYEGQIVELKVRIKQLEEKQHPEQRAER